MKNSETVGWKTKMTDDGLETIDSIRKILIRELMDRYWSPLYKYLQENPNLIGTFPGFLLHPEEIILYMGRTHIAVEYKGPEVVSGLVNGVEILTRIHDHSTSDCNLMEKIIGFEYDSSLPDSFMTYPQFSCDLFIPTNKGFESLIDLGWNFAAQEMVFGINTPCPSASAGQFHRIVNSFFFDADNTGLKTRYIKWLDLYPIGFDGSDSEIDRFTINLGPLEDLVERDAHFIFPAPEEYKYEKLPVLNRFIELWGNKASKETTVTSFLADPERHFILSMRFGAIEIHSELECEWQSESKNSIKPDFFIVNTDGYADIVEFKKPTLKGSSVVGTSNRETLSAEIASYVSQTRVYQSYFDDPNNRRWVEKKYGFKVHKPKRWLVIGRRSHFSSDEWKEIVSEYNDLQIISYDDLVDGVAAQFYM